MKKLIISHLSFKFSTHKEYFFRDVNIEFDSGKMYFIQGRNGIGKSTFFSILQGTTPGDAQLNGTVTFDNKEYIIERNAMSHQLCAHIKTMMQDSNKMVVNSMTVQENLQLAQLQRYPGLKRLAHLVEVPSILHEFGIDPHSRVQRLSGGQRQILAIIMALQKPTHILLLDEPTAALDDNNSHMVMKFLASVAQQRDLIVIIITHDKELTQAYAGHQKIIIKKEKNEETRTLDYAPSQIC